MTTPDYSVFERESLTEVAYDLVTEIIAAAAKRGAALDPDDVIDEVMDWIGNYFTEHAPKEQT